MSESKFTPQEKNEILKKVIRKTNRYYEDTVRQKESGAAEDLLKEIEK